MQNCGHDMQLLYLLPQYYTPQQQPDIFYHQEGSGDVIMMNNPVYAMQNSGQIMQPIHVLPHFYSPPQQLIYHQEATENMVNNPMYPMENCGHNFQPFYLLPHYYAPQQPDIFYHQEGSGDVMMMNNPVFEMQNSGQIMQPLHVLPHIYSPPQQLIYHQEATENMVNNPVYPMQHCGQNLQPIYYLPPYNNLSTSQDTNYQGDTETVLADKVNENSIEETVSSHKVHVDFKNDDSTRAMAKDILINNQHDQICDGLDPSNQNTPRVKNRKPQTGLNSQTSEKITPKSPLVIVCETYQHDQTFVGLNPSNLNTPRFLKEEESSVNAVKQLCAYLQCPVYNEKVNENSIEKTVGSLRVKNRTPKTGLNSQTSEKITPKSALKIVSETYKIVEFKIEEFQNGSDLNYTASVTIDDKFYSGSDCKMIQAMENACDNFLRFSISNKLKNSSTADFLWNKYASLDMYKFIHEWILDPLSDLMEKIVAVSEHTVAQNKNYQTCDGFAN